MDPESFAEYLGSQSLLDMMENAHTVRKEDEDGDMAEDGGVHGGVIWGGSTDRERVRDRDRGWNRSAEKSSTACFLST